MGSVAERSATPASSSSSTDVHQPDDGTGQAVYPVDEQDVELPGPERPPALPAVLAVAGGSGGLVHVPMGDLHVGLRPDVLVQPSALCLEGVRLVRLVGRDPGQS